MKLTRESDYAIKIVIFLAKLPQGEIASAKEVSEKEKIPLKYSLKILKNLCDVNIAESFRGSKGGYHLKRSPEKISLKAVIEATQGSLYMSPSLVNIGNFDKVKDNPVNSFLYTLQEEMRKRLKEKKIIDLL